MAPSDLASLLAGTADGKSSAAASPAPAGSPPDLGLETQLKPEQVPVEEGPGIGAAPLAAHPLHDAPVLIGGRYEVLTDAPLPDLSSPTADAYAARVQDAAKSDYCAYVVRSGLPARTDIFGALRSVESPSVMRLVDYAVVYWPPDEECRPVILFELPNGGRLVRSLKQGRQPLTEDQVTRNVILPIMSALKELKTRRVFHGTINPTNLFVHERGGSSAVQLGECLTAPAGYNQPAFFETIERGMAMPSGRGNGTIADDLYALGATVLYLVQGSNPLAERDAESVVAAKIEKGSFAAMSGDSRLPLGMVEPLRGLLMDDPQQRWTLEDLDLWVSGRRLSPKQSQPPKRAPRPLSFAGNDYWNARSVGVSLTASPFAGNALVESGELDNWLRRSLDDEAVANRVAEAVRSASAGRGGSPEERRIARVAMALDPSAPIRYRGRAVMPEGIGGALAEAMITGSGAQEIAEIITGQLPMFWVNVQQTVRSDHIPIARTFDMMRAHLERAEPGFGLERCLYELNPSMPCLSPMLAGRYILELDELLRALEEIAGSPDRPRDPVDRHVAAFILARRGTLEDAPMVGLLSQDERHRATALLTIFCELQALTRVVPLPKLCAWIAETLEPAVARFNSRTVRERMAEEMKKQAATGVFKNLYTLVQNQNLAARDATAFQMARREFARITRDLAVREEELETREEVARSLGRQLAAVAASVLSAAILVGIVLTQTG
jgi:hypothetical protein